MRPEIVPFLSFALLAGQEDIMLGLVLELLLFYPDHSVSDREFYTTLSELFASLVESWGLHRAMWALSEQSSRLFREPFTSPILYQPPVI